MVGKSCYNIILNVTHAKNAKIPAIVTLSCLHRERSQAKQALHTYLHSPVTLTSTVAFPVQPPGTVTVQV